MSPPISFLQKDPLIGSVTPYKQSPNGNNPIPIIISGEGFPTADRISVNFGSGIVVQNIQVYQLGSLLTSIDDGYGDEIRCNIIISNTSLSGFRNIVVTNQETFRFSTLSGVFEVTNAGSTGIDWSVLGDRILKTQVQSNSNLLQNTNVFIDGNLVGKTTFSIDVFYNQILGGDGITVTAKKDGYITTDYFILKLEARHNVNNSLVNPPFDGLQYEEVEGITNDDIKFILFVTRYDVETNIAYPTYEYFNANEAVLNFTLEKPETFQLNISPNSTTLFGDGGISEFSTTTSNPNIQFEIISDQSWLSAVVKEQPTGGGGGSGAGDGSIPIEEQQNFEANSVTTGNRTIVVNAISYTNSTNVNRVGKITVSPIGDYKNLPNLQPRTYTVTQSPIIPETPTFTISKTSHTFEKEGGKTTFNIVTSNGQINWAIAIDGKPNFVTLNNSLGAGNSTITINAPLNSSQNDRINTIVVKPTGQLSSLPEQKLIVTQKATPPTVTWSLNKTEESFGGKGGKITFEVRPSNETVTWSVSEVVEKTTPKTIPFTSQIISGGIGQLAQIGQGTKSVEITVFEAIQSNLSSIRNTKIFVNPTGVWEGILQPLVFDISQFLDSIPDNPFIVDVVFNGEPQQLTANRDIEVDANSIIVSNQNIKPIAIKVVKSQINSTNLPEELTFTPVTSLLNRNFANLNSNNFTITKIVYSSANRSFTSNREVFPSNIPAIPVEYIGESFPESTVTAEIFVHYKNGDSSPQQQTLIYTLNPKVIGEFNFKVTPPIQTIYATSDGNINSSQISPYKVEGIDPNGNKMVCSKTLGELQPSQFYYTLPLFFDPNGTRININRYSEKIKNTVGGIYINENKISTSVPTIIKGTSEISYKDETGRINFKTITFELQVLKTDDPILPPPSPITSTFELQPKEIVVTVLGENSRIITPSFIPVISTTGMQSIRDTNTGNITNRVYNYNGNSTALLNNQYRITNISGVPVDTTQPLSSTFQIKIGEVLTSSLTGTVSIEYVDENGRRGSSILNFFIKRVISQQSSIQSQITPISQNVTVNTNNELITPLTDYKLYVEEVNEFGKTKMSYSNSKNNSTYYISKVEIFDNSTNSITPGLVGTPNTNEEIILFGNLVPNRLNVVTYIDFVDRFGNTGQRIIPAYISRDVLPPQITLIEWPQFINGADYKGYDQPFNVRFTSENALNIKIYVSNIAENRFYNQYSPNDIASFNVQDLINNYQLPTMDGGTFSFNLVLVPMRGNIVGKEEVVTVTYDASDLQIERSIVISNFEKVIETTFDFDIYKDEVSKFLTHFINFDDREPILISNWERDDISLSEFVEDELGNQILVKENPTLILKLYEPLPENIQPLTSIWITKQRS